MNRNKEHCKLGETLEDREAREKKSSMELIAEDYGWDVLWKCRICGKYWEAKYKGRYAEDEILTCISEEEVNLRYADKIRGKQK